MGSSNSGDGRSRDPSGDRAEAPAAVSGLVPEALLGYQVAHLARLLGRELRSRLAPSGVGPGQFAQLLVLYQEDGLTQAELCARVHIEQPTMANTLDRMQRDGLITREPDPRDGRRAIVRLTARAREMEAELIDAVTAGNAATVQGLDQDAVGHFMDAVSTMIGNLAGRPHSSRGP